MMEISSFAEDLDDAHMNCKLASKANRTPAVP